MQNLPIPELRLPGLAIEHLDVDTGTAKFDLTLQVEETDSGLAGSLEYNTDLFDADTIDRLIGHFHVLLEGAAADPDRRVSMLPLLTGEERRELLIRAGENAPERSPRGESAPPAASREAPAAESAGARGLYELFEDQAGRSPEAVAITCEGLSLTYEELSARAGRVARLLRDRGVGPE